MKVLVACEFSGVVREAFRRRGHDAYSCDFLEAEDSQEFHYRGDVRMYWEWEWDLMIAHPPCTFLTIAGARYKNDPGRHEGRRRAIDFMRDILNAPVPKIAVENPIPFGEVCKEIGLYDQIIHPYHFGENDTKKTCLWLRGLPLLMPTKILPKPEPRGFCIRKSGPRAGRRYNYYFHQSKSGHDRSRTFQGIADAMADQWGV